MTLKDAKHLAIKVLSKTLDMTKLTSEKIEMATLQRIGGQTIIKILSGVEVNELISEHEKNEAAVEAAKKDQKSKM